MKVVAEDQFQHEVAHGVTLVDFYADWCAPCRMLAPVLEEVSEEMNGKAKVIKIDVDKSQRLASQFGVTSIPTMILMKNGKEVGRIVGVRDADAIKEFIQEAM